MNLRGTPSLSIVILLAACSGVSRTVDMPRTDVRLALTQNESTLSLADQLPGASHFTEPTEQGVTWHFTFSNQDYARYFIAIADRTRGSHVSGRFEEVAGPSSPAVPYL